MSDRVDIPTISPASISSGWPSDRLATADPNGRADAERWLVSLIAADDAIEQHLGLTSAYIVENEFLRRVSSQDGHEDSAKQVDIEALVLLDNVDMIFRFTCATKFEWPIPDKQVRASGWGKRHAIEHRLRHTRGLDYGRVYSAVAEMLECNVDRYRELASTFSARPSRPSDVWGLNQGLELQLVF